jgi:hypothetical protein
MRVLLLRLLADDTRLFKSSAANVGYLPGRSTTHRPLNPMPSHTSHRAPMTTADDARSLKRWRSMLLTWLSVVKDRPSKSSR